jgi:hypothetical protein
MIIIAGYFSKENTFRCTDGTCMHSDFAKLIARLRNTRRTLCCRKLQYAVPQHGVSCYRNDPNITALQSKTSSLLLLKARRSRP